jgi:hypothetical protein
MAQCDARRIRKTAQRQSGLLLPSREEKSMADGNRYEKDRPVIARRAASAPPMMRIAYTEKELIDGHDGWSARFS